MLPIASSSVNVSNYRISEHATSNSQSKWIKKEILSQFFTACLWKISTFISCCNFSIFLHKLFLLPFPRVIYYCDMTSSLCCVDVVVRCFTFLSLYIIFNFFLSSHWFIAMDDMKSRRNQLYLVCLKIVQNRGEMEQKKIQPSSIYEHEHELKMRVRQATRTLTMMAKASNVSKNILLWKKKDIVNGTEWVRERENPTPLLHKYQLSRHAWHRGWWDLIYDSWNSKSKNGIIFFSSFFFPLRREWVSGKGKEAKFC